jgi:hypothetical protein
MIINPIICEKCNIELQPEHICVDVEDGNLVRVCAYCGNRIKITEAYEGVK